MGIVSAFCMAIAIILSLVYAGIEDNPVYGYGGNYPELGEVKTSVTIPGNPGFVNGLNAVLKWVPRFILLSLADRVASLSSGSVKSSTPHLLPR